MDTATKRLIKASICGVIMTVFNYAWNNTIVLIWSKVLGSFLIYTVAFYISFYLTEKNVHN